MVIRTDRCLWRRRMPERMTGLGCRCDWGVRVSVSTDIPSARTVIRAVRHNEKIFLQIYVYRVSCSLANSATAHVLTVPQVPGQVLLRSACRIVQQTHGAAAGWRQRVARYRAAWMRCGFGYPGCDEHHALRPAGCRRSVSSPCELALAPRAPRLPTAGGGCGAREGLQIEAMCSSPRVSHSSLLHHFRTGGVSLTTVVSAVSVPHRTGFQYYPSIRPDSPVRQTGCRLLAKRCDARHTCVIRWLAL